MRPAPALAPRALHTSHAQRVAHRPPLRCRTGELRSDDPEEEKKQRLFTACINKLTVDNFDRIFLQMRDIEVTSVKTLRGFVDQIFNKALAETIFCEMYSRLCHDLHEILPQCAAAPARLHGSVQSACRHCV